MLSRTLLFVLTLAAAGTTAQAGDGFPPFGAWAYGTRGPSWGHHFAGYRGGFYGGHHWKSHRFGYPRYSFSSYSFAYRSPLALTAPIGNCYYPGGYYPGGWSYGYRSYFAYPRVSYVQVTTPYVFQYGCFPSYSTFSYSSAFAPVYAPAYVAPICVSNNYSVSVDPVYYSTSSGSGEGSRNYIVHKPEISPATLADAQPVPPELLEAADRILAAGGYRQAAVAYAQLTERYGSNTQLLGRRFIAQALAEDVDQAVVIAASARLLDEPMVAELLPGQSLKGLGIDTATADRVAEQLAAFAVSQPDAADPLAAVAYWLQLNGDSEKAALFLARVDQLESATLIADTKQSNELPTSPTASSKTKFVAVE